MTPDIRLTDQPLDVAAATAAVNTPDAGGIDIFLGTTRAETHTERGGLVALEYHAYPEMAMAEMQKLAVRAAAQWPVQRVAIWHRLGTVEVGAPSVIIAVSTPHRAESFAACQFIIDELKKSVPLWKKELYTREAHWQGGVEGRESSEEKLGQP
jgi:molybdopterin synthase catalytic subunit